MRISISVMVFAAMLTACGGKDDAAAPENKASSGAECSLVSTIDGSPLNIKVTAEDSDAAKIFLETCRNSYNEIFAQDAKALKKLGKRAYNYNNCTGCHVVT